MKGLYLPGGMRWNTAKKELKVVVVIFPASHFTCAVLSLPLLKCVFVRPGNAARLRASWCVFLDSRGRGETEL